MNNYDLSHSAASEGQDTYGVGFEVARKLEAERLRGAIPATPTVLEQGQEYLGGPVQWCTDGQGNSWAEEPMVDVHWLVVFFGGAFVGATLVSVMWYVW